MFSDFWLLSDLDGTLIATPHKAKGRYLPITQSPCFEPIKKWLGEGGNVCVITTADARVIEQVYLPLRHCLKTYREYVADMEGGSISTSNMNESASEPRRRGCLLLSLYTGAVLYWCTADSMIMLPGYANALHCATRESVDLASAHQVSMPQAQFFADDGGSQLGIRTEACVRGTCFDAATAHSLQSSVEKLFFTFVKDVLSRKDAAVIAGMKWLSRRYRCMWGSLLQYLNLLHDAAVHEHTSTQLFLGHGAERVLASLDAQPPADPAEVEWKMQYLRSRRGFLTAVGILRVEYVEACLRYGRDDNFSATPPANTRAVLRGGDAEEQLLAAYAEQVLLADLSASVASAVAAPTKAIAGYLVGLLGPNSKDLRRQMSAAGLTKAQEELFPVSPSSASLPCPDPCLINAEENIAQVILLGIPLRFFSKYFRSHVPDMVRGGVIALPQPNSVVFSKIGVSKSTALRYLFGKDRAACRTDGAPWKDPVHRAREGSARCVTNFAGCVRGNHSVAMGDNPQSTDYELTVFEEVPFMSMENEPQRAERHKRIHRRLQRSLWIERGGGKPSMPDGSPAPSHAQLVESLRRSGPMMDDRLCPNIHYVGAEEEGTSLFLTSVLHHAANEAKGRAHALTAAEFKAVVGKAERASRAAVMERSASSKL